MGNVSAGFSAIRILIISIIGILGLNYLVIRFYTMIVAILVGKQCRKESLSAEASKEYFERFLNKEAQAEICRAGKHLFLALTVSLILCVYLWFYGTLQEQQVVQGILLTVNIIAIAVYAVGLVTKNVSLFSLPKSAYQLSEAEMKTTLPFPKTLAKYNITFLILSVICAIVYWLLVL